MLILETKNGVFEAFVAGEGEPLCVTHLYSEFNANGNRFANMFVPFFKVYLVNLRGCGNSTDDISKFNYSMNVKKNWHLKNLLKQLFNNIQIQLKEANNDVYKFYHHCINYLHCRLDDRIKRSYESI